MSWWWPRDTGGAPPPPRAPPPPSGSRYIAPLGCRWAHHQAVGGPTTRTAIVGGTTTRTAIVGGTTTRESVPMNFESTVIKTTLLKLLKLSFLQL
ncbi:hypothetical protein FNV43_RR09789 [Rhamnella rubrinervis]|uniref:Uncharacterized protein n=1 Tax=Rhamnella rubrinervis TaxID=2594499 RepID=A0A8K0HB35_9ROSA|nr:hypothetical protein FNV43_RR09789 [Rhamnella rubrinervis]